ncbi:MAG: T9SS type A sorting domain-containing protein [Crocinitomicaceae bacterium]|nr:T9SS type A sorting domain-containing protein [Crocinitomicaceae bacterium]
MKLYLLLLFLTFSSSNIYSQFGQENLITGDTLNHFQAGDVKAADIDQDGLFDIVLGTWTNTEGSKVAWHQNQGNDKFSELKFIAYIPERLHDIDTSDIDNDGDIDVVFSTLTGEMYWSENTGTEIWNTNLIADFSSPMKFVNTADLDNDGDEDIAFTSGNSGLGWFENTGSGTFVVPANSIVMLPGNPWKFKLGDLNTDGKIDVLVTMVDPGSGNALDQFSWYENLGGGSFGPENILYEPISGISAASHDLEIEDMDLDGDLDVVFLENNKLSWVENIGGGVFNPAQILASATSVVYREIELHDFDNDNDIDILVLEGAEMILYENQGGMLFGTGQVISSGIADCENVCITDFNQDGLNDICSVSQYTGEFVFWHKNLGVNNFQTHLLISKTTELPKMMAIADIDNDGFNDIVIGALGKTSLSWYKNDGTNNFPYQSVVSYSVQGVNHIDVFDYDGDGDNDIFACLQTGPMSYSENLGNGNFAPEVILNTYSGVKYFEFTDLTGDGIMDVILNTNSNHIKWNQGFGGTVFSNHQTVGNASGNVYVGFTCFDADQDGDQDVVLVKNESVDHLHYYENLGGGNFAPYVDLGNGSGTIKKVIHCDINNDGNEDLVICGESLNFFTNTGGSFAATGWINMEDHNYVQFYDVNQDGLGDLITVSNTTNEIAWYQNLGNFSFSPKQLISNQVEGPFSLITGDIDLDGDEDILSASTDDNTVAWYENYIYGKTSISGRVYFDIDSNKVYNDTIDIDASYLPVYSVPASDYTYTYIDGKYLMHFTDTVGSYLIFLDSIPGWSIITDSLTYSVVIDTTFTGMDSVDFGIYPDSLFDAVETQLVGGFPRCNTTSNYWMNFTNIGSNLSSGYIELQLDSLILFNSAEVAPDSIVGQNVYWHFDSLQYFSSDNILAYLNLPGFGYIGDTITSYLYIYTQDSLGNVTSVSMDSLQQEIVCAYDPNDKIVTPKGFDSLGFIPMSSQTLEYTVRFQNTGNDTALTVKIEDQLSPFLDWQSVDYASSSHPVIISIEQSGKIQFLFESIMLPDSNVNEPASHGYVQFNIELQPGLSPWTTIENSAEIYFDYNPPVITNTIINTLYDCTNLFEGLTVTTNVCDSINLLATTVKPFNYDWSILDVNITNENELGVQLDTTGSFNLVVKLSNGMCPMEDSIVSVDMIPSQTILAPDTVYICANDSVLIYNNYYSSQGLHFDTINALPGCDTILSKYLNVYPIYDNLSTDTLSICFEDSMMISNSYQNSTGLYFDTLQSIYGCDSVLPIYLDVHNQVPSQQFPDLYICPGDSILVFGQYRKQTGVYSDTLQNIYGCDSILNQQINFYSAYEYSLGLITACNGDSALIFGQYQSYPGIYYDTLQTIAGCDSIVSLDFSIIQIDTTLSINGLTISASSSAGTYQWLDCNNNYSPIINEVSQTFNPILNGSYAVQISENGCTDTSACIIIEGIGLDENKIFEDLSISPNPTDESVIIDYGHFTKVNIKVYDPHGELVSEINENTPVNLSILDLKGPAGIYLIKINIGTTWRTYQVVKN